MGPKECDFYCPLRMYGVGAQQSWLHNFIILFRTLVMIMVDTIYNFINEIPPNHILSLYYAWNGT